MVTFLNITKHVSTVTNTGKNLSAFSNIQKATADDCLLQENGDFLLLETGFNIILEQSTGFINYVNVAKS